MKRKPAMMKQTKNIKFLKLIPSIQRFKGTNYIDCIDPQLKQRNSYVTPPVKESNQVSCSNLNDEAPIVSRINKKWFDCLSQAHSEITNFNSSSFLSIGNFQEIMNKGFILQSLQEGFVSLLQNPSGHDVNELLLMACGPFLKYHCLTN